jgi:hypothetical protein
MQLKKILEQAMLSNNHRMDPVFLLSPGRSGSTLLQRHLNSSKDLTLWGEHGAIIKGLKNTYKSWYENQHVQYLLKSQSKHVQSLLASEAVIGMDIEWTNNLSREHFRKSLANMVAELFTVDIPEQSRWGFKEIRYDDTDVFFLKELFPEAQFVFIVRNPINTLASAIVTFAKGQALWETTKQSADTNTKIKEQIQFWSDKLAHIAKGISNCLIKNEGYLVKYEEIKENPLESINLICKYLRISLPTSEHTRLIAEDVRHGMNTTEVRRRLLNDFLNDGPVQNLLSIYKSLGYN